MFIMKMQNSHCLLGFFSHIVFNRNPFLQLREGVRKEIVIFRNFFFTGDPPPQDRSGIFFEILPKKSVFKDKNTYFGQFRNPGPPP